VQAAIIDHYYCCLVKLYRSVSECFSSTLHRNSGFRLCWWFMRQHKRSDVCPALNSTLSP